MRMTLISSGGASLIPSRLPGVLLLTSEFMIHLLSSVRQYNGIAVERNWNYLPDSHIQIS